ncbi:MAG: c-type cytochrome, partial [Cyclobacteriaceae bacterium]
GAFPPLKETDWVQGDKEKLISIVLNGLQGPITVNGEQYNNVMTPHNFLSDDEVAAVLTFVRNSFGNNASEVMAEEVAALRDQVEK